MMAFFATRRKWRPVAAPPWIDSNRGRPLGNKETNHLQHPLLCRGHCQKEARSRRFRLGCKTLQKWLTMLRRRGSHGAI